MNRSFPAILFFSFFCLHLLQAQPQWQPAASPLTTPWTDKVSPQNALPEYPRPQMVRHKWMNLNGLWDFLVMDKNTEKIVRQGKILVPYPIESALSGVGMKLEPHHILVYKLRFGVPQDWAGERVLLHFGAVDWAAEISVNNQKVGSHKGGYDPFTLDVTDFLTPRFGQELTVQVTDPGSSGGQPVGKQHLNPQGIWYVGTSGIWQTVWLEPVAKNYVKRLRVEPDLDRERVVVKVETGGEKNDKLRITAKVVEADRQLSESSGRQATPLLLKVPSPRAWTPDDPYLYDLEVTLEDGAGKQLDKVRSYFGMRKISLGKDDKGFTRLLLNNRFVFQIGPLDQGFFPDGLYTPPTEDAMKFDLEALKNMGFNMIRKHVKVEPERWYYLCDKMGFLVWQDMPSGGNQTEADREQFRVELKAMVENLFNHPSIVTWVPFNEGWGQHDDEQIVQTIKELDPTRLVNNASGWTDKGFGDMMDIHEYPGPAAPKPEEKRATVLGEFGGLGLNVAGHQWTTTGWGYDLIQTPENLLTRYEDLWRRLLPLVDSAGLSAAVYTQTSDIETENNGLLTYDRKVTKMDASLLRLAHEGYLPPKPAANPRIFVKKTAVDLRTLKPGAEIFYTFDEKAPAEKWLKYQSPVPLKKSKTIWCRATWANGKSSHAESHSFKKVKPLGSKPPKKPAAGIALKIYEGAWDKLPDFKTLQPAKELTVNEYGLSEVGKTEDFALVFEGWIEAPETGVYVFYCTSDDGSRLFVAHQKLVENDGLHGMKEASGSLALKKGMHPVRLEFFQKKGGVGLKLEWEGAGVSRRQL